MDNNFFSKKQMIGSIHAIIDFSLVSWLISHNFIIVYGLFKENNLISFSFFINIIILLLGLRIIHIIGGQFKDYLGYYIPFVEDFDEYLEKLKLRDIQKYIEIGYTFIAFFILQIIYYCYRAYCPDVDNDTILAIVRIIVLVMICEQHFFKVNHCYNLLRQMALSDEIKDRKLSEQYGEKCTEHKDKRIKEFLEDDDE